MASPRVFSRALRSAPATSTFKNATIRSLSTRSQAAFQHQTHRQYSGSTSKRRGNVLLYGGLAATLLSVAALYSINRRPTLAEEPQAQENDYQAVYNAIAARLIEEDDYDDGSYGPVLLRLGWHASGTYDAATGTGGSNGATMRFASEKEHGANLGLKAGRDFLKPIKEEFPWISYSDLWTLAAVCAVQEMGGPTIGWRPGRQDRGKTEGWNGLHWPRLHVAFASNTC